MEAGNKEKCPSAIEGKTVWCAIKDEARTMRSKGKGGKRAEEGRENGESTTGR
jgi:hypothetical protein